MGANVFWKFAFFTWTTVLGKILNIYNLCKRISFKNNIGDWCCMCKFSIVS
jgi:hypothetical protein